MTTSRIEWTDKVWNPVTGCTKVSAGCKNCYAETFAGRGIGSFAGGRKFTDVRTHADRLDAPLRWRKPRRVFVNSMSDLFHDDVPDEFIDRVFGVMALSQYVGRCRRRDCSHEGFACNDQIDEPTRHTFQVLTKRPQRMRDYCAHPDRRELVEIGALNVWQTSDDALVPMLWPLPNVWLGVSCEDQKAADERIPLLLQTPAAVRFLSCEPLLGPIDIGLQSATCKCCDRWPSRWVRLHRPVGPDMPELIGTKSGTWIADCGVYRARSNPHGALSVQTPGGLLGIKPAEFECLPGIDWVIAGGESGPGARPCDVAWIRSIVEQCKAAGVACFVKQLGAHVVASGLAQYGWPIGEVQGLTSDCSRVPPRIHLPTAKGGNPDEWPEDLRVRQFPEARP